MEWPRCRGQSEVRPKAQPRELVSTCMLGHDVLRRGDAAGQKADPFNLGHASIALQFLFRPTWLHVRVHNLLWKVSR